MFLLHLLIFICVHLFLFVRTSLFYLSEPILICQNLFLFVKTYFLVRIYFHLSKSFFICQNLFSSLRISSSLWSSVRISFYLWSSVRIYFLSLHENKQVYEYHHLKQIFYHQNTIMIFLLTSYVPFSCFLFWILLILCLVTFLFSKVFSYSFNSTAIFTPFVVLDSLPSSESIQCNFDFHPTNLLIGISLHSSSFCERPFYFDYHKT